MKVKICGVQSIEEAMQLAEMGVDFVGLNFVSTSSRYIDLPTGKAIAESLKNTPTLTVALFQDHPLEVVQDYIHAIRPDLVQLHGEERDEYIAQLSAPVIKSITSGREVTSLSQYYLLDRISRGQGPVIDVIVAAAIVEKYPESVFLAGGLTSENLPDILMRVRPFGIDIADGVRTGNVLDFEKVKKILNIVRSAS
jgi:phosphoribosylanthranilate isomerase